MVVPITDKGEFGVTNLASGSIRFIVDCKFLTELNKLKEQTLLKIRMAGTLGSYLQVFQ